MQAGGRMTNTSGPPTHQGGRNLWVEGNVGFQHKTNPAPIQRQVTAGQFNQLLQNLSGSEQQNALVKI